MYVLQLGHNKRKAKGIDYHMYRDRNDWMCNALEKTKNSKIRYSCQTTVFPHQDAQTGLRLDLILRTFTQLVNYTSSHEEQK